MPTYLDTRFVLSVLPTILSLRDGNYWCIDGQHRAAEACTQELEQVPALIIKGLTRQQEALLFAYINDGARRPQLGELLKALEFGGDSETSALMGMLRDEGLTPKNGRLTPNDGYATISLAKSSVRWVLKRPNMGLEHLRRVVRLLLRAWPNTPELFSPVHVRAVATLLVRLDKSSQQETEEELVRAFRAVRLGLLRDDAVIRQRKSKSLSPNGIHMEHALADAMEAWLRACRETGKQAS